MTKQIPGQAIQKNKLKRAGECHYTTRMNFSMTIFANQNTFV